MNPLVSLSLHWFESWRCTAELNRRNLEEMRRWRNRMFQDVSFCMESYMRSPAFLGLMRYNMMMMSQVRRPLGADTSSTRELDSGAQGRNTDGASTSVAVTRDSKGGGEGGGSSSPLAMVEHLKEVPVGGTLSTSGTSSQE